MNKKSTDWKDLLHVRDVRSLLTGLLLLGSFVIFATTAVAYLTSRNFLDKHYTLQVRFSDGTGLSKGGKVLFKGVQVGTLDKISFDDAGKVILSLSIETMCRDDRSPCQANDFIRRGAVANVIRAQNMVSDKVINIVDTLGPGRAPLEDHEWLVTGMVMDVQATLDSLAILTQHLRGTMSQIDTVLRLVTDTNGTLGALLVKKDLYSHTLRTLSIIDAAVGQSGQVISSFDRLGGRLETDLPQLLHRADTLTQNLNHTARRADTLATAGLRLLDRTNGLAEQADVLVNDGGHLLDRTNRMVDGLSNSWFLRGYVRPDRTPQDRIPVGSP